MEGIVHCFFSYFGISSTYMVAVQTSELETTLNTLNSNLFKSHFHVIFPSMPSSSKGFPSVLQKKNMQYVLHAL